MLRSDQSYIQKNFRVQMMMAAIAFMNEAPGSFRAHSELSMTEAWADIALAPTNKTIHLYHLCSSLCHQLQLHEAEIQRSSDRTEGRRK